MDAKMQSIVDELHGMPWVEAKKLDKLIGDCAELEGRLRAAREKLLALRPSQKEYDENLSRLSIQVTALQSQLDAAQADLEGEIAACRRKAIEGADLSHLQEEARKLDEKALNALAAAYKAIERRHEITVQHNRLVDVLGAWAHDLGVANPPRLLQSAARSPWPSHPKDALKQYVERFLSMLIGNLPEDGDLLAWFERRVW